MPCGHCHAVRQHHTNVCPQRVADVRGDADKGRASGKLHQVNGCGSKNHNHTHHQLALQDHEAKILAEATKGCNHQRETQQKGKGGGKEAGKNRKPKETDSRPQPEEKPPDGYKSCKWKHECKSAKTDGTCDDWHPKAEWKAFTEQCKAVRIVAKPAEQQEGGSAEPSSTQGGGKGGRKGKRKRGQKGKGRGGGKDTQPTEQPKPPEGGTASVLQLQQNQRPKQPRD